MFTHKINVSGHMLVEYIFEKQNDRTCDAEALYSGTSVHELNSFLEAVREPKCS
jgi:hypothetical protein